MAKTELFDFLSYGIDGAGRRIYFGAPLDGSDEDIGTFTQRSVELAVRAMHRLVAEGPGKPIELHMNSGGGDAYAMLRLHDEILSCPCQVKFYGSGMVMSAATWIMAVCDERYLYPNTTVMVHDGSEELHGTHTDVKISAAESKRLQDQLYDIYAANTKMPRTFWESVCNRDLYLTAQEAVMLGLADKIVEPKKRGNLRKMRQAAFNKQGNKSELQALMKSIYARVNCHTVPVLKLNNPVKELSDPNVIIEEGVDPTPNPINGDNI